MFRILCLRLLVGLVLVCGVAGGSARAQLPDLVIELGDVEAFPGDSMVHIPITMSNFYQGVAGFDLRLTVEHPELIEFSGPKSVIIDSTWFFCTAYDGLGNCVDSFVTLDTGSQTFMHVDTITHYFEAVDSAGCLVSGWEVIDVRSIRQNGMTVRIVGLADNFGGLVVPPIPVQNGGVLLRLLVDAAAIGNEVMMREARFEPILAPDQFCFSSPEGQCIGLTSTEVVDTTCYRCNVWDNGICVDWSITDEPPCDSLAIVVDTANAYPSSAVVADSGSLAILRCGLGSELPTPVDVSTLVDFLFSGGGAPNRGRADANCSCALDPIDLSALVDYLFGGEPLPDCAN